MTVAQTNLAELKKTSKMVAAQAGIGSVKTFFESQKSTLAAVLPKHVSPDRMLKIALGALRTTPKLMECTVESLMGAVVQCSQLGLEPNTPLGHAYLIPFEKKKQQNGRWVTDKVETQIVIGYKGLIDLARRSGQVVSIAAHAVREGDHFEYAYGLDEKLEHKPAMSGRGRVVAFYAVAKLVGGGHAFEVMSAEQVNEIRDASQNYKFARDKEKTVWGQHYEEMGRKTVLRRLFKYLPVSIELANASALDGLHARGESQALDNVLEGDYITPASDYAEGDDEPPAQIDNQPGDVPIDFDANGFAEKLRACKDVETLDLMADELRDLPQDVAAPLLDIYHARRDEITGA
ncbi:recombination protein RecT [Cupriavidus gilardii]|uniref:recombination protein RecT n=1 Tax=Cupriavidus gilardii TaxID=82541 RepID=UPI001572A644|nr:recombination protein RecT [Cupriavidus gilardii]NSX06042.1 recombination protein RecT [Cupriavidus gilardii]